MLVATTIMAVAVVGLLSNLSTSMRNAARLTDHDRASLLAKRKMDELLLEPRLPKFSAFGAEFDPALTGGSPAGWSARVTPFEMPPWAGPGTPILERVELEVWWTAGAQRKTVHLEAYRRGILSTADAPPAGGQP